MSGPSSFGDETVICGDDDGAVEEGEFEGPVREELGEKRRARYLFCGCQNIESCKRRVHIRLCVHTKGSTIFRKGYRCMTDYT